MERTEFARLIAPLSLAMRTELDRATLGAYFRVLENVPAVLFEAAVNDYLSRPLEFFPKAPEMRSACELQRRRQLAAVPYEACAECEGQKGWRTIKGSDGYERMERCPCRARYQAVLESRGIGAAVAQLPGEAEPQGEQYYPTADQLPTELRTRLLEAVKQKVLR